MKKYYFFPYCLILLCASTYFSCQGQSPKKTQKNTEHSTNSEKADKIDQLVKQYTDYGGFNGTILVAHEGKVLFKKGFGLANMEWDLANTTDTKFQIASITKQFTAMLIMKLVAKEKIDLYLPISNYLPDYPSDKSSKITLHHLLTHTSGIPNAKNKENAFRPNDLVNQFANEPLNFEPGNKFEYSNSGYTLLGLIIEKVTGKGYEEVLNDEILKPLGMKNTGFFHHRPIIKNMSSGYNKWYGDYFDVDQSDHSSAYSAGGMYSTVEDLFIWDKALYSDVLLPKEYMDIIFSKHIDDPEYGGFYGYGWELIKKELGSTDQTVETTSHGGSIGGYRTSFSRIPVSKSTIIMLNNTNHAFLNAISKGVLGILYEKPYELPKKPIAQFMVEVINQEGLEKGMMYFKEHQKSNDYYLSEEELIVAGYRFLHEGKVSIAAEIFKLTVEAFPDRDNPYDSYAEALMQQGKKDEAIKNYKKSLEINPNNFNAKKMLLELEKRTSD